MPRNSLTAAMHGRPAAKLAHDLRRSPIDGRYRASYRLPEGRRRHNEGGSRRVIALACRLARLWDYGGFLI